MTTHTAVSHVGGGKVSVTEAVRRATEGAWYETVGHWMGFNFKVIGFSVSFPPPPYGWKTDGSLPDVVVTILSQKVSPKEAR